ncbi:hypothetical protein HYT55_04875 [Candidatus Woesearchaeota archaeon]|nr:hypothetical protein [Candidatus Woesearchaeota archaeon]
MRRTLLSLGLIAALLGTSAPARADEPNHSLFAGTLLNSGSLDTIIDYRHKNGAQVTVEETSRPWDQEVQNTLNSGLRTPRLLDGKARISGIADASLLDDTVQRWGATGLVEVFPVKQLTLRAAGLYNSQGINGGALGIKMATDQMTLDYDFGHTGTEAVAQGFAAYVINDQLYLSFGGVAREELLNFVVGWMNPDLLGVYTQTSVDLKNDTQRGKVLVADKFTYGKRTFDFKSHALNGTEMQRVATGGALNGWAAPDAYATKHCAATVNWSNGPAAAAVEATVFHWPTERVFFGLGGKNTYDKRSGEHTPSVSAEFYTKLLGPVESWAKVDLDLDSGDLNATFYLGSVNQF